MTAKILFSACPELAQLCSRPGQGEECLDRSAHQDLQVAGLTANGGDIGVAWQREMQDEYAASRLAGCCGVVSTCSRGGIKRRGCDDRQPHPWRRPLQPRHWPLGATLQKRQIQLPIQTPVPALTANKHTPDLAGYPATNGWPRAAVTDAIGFGPESSRIY